VPAAIAVGDGSVWVTGQLDDRVARIDPATNLTIKTIKVGREPLGVAVGDGAVWVADTIDRTHYSHRPGDEPRDEDHRHRQEPDGDHRRRRVNLGGGR
jgi:YVTN family beta-propeller protein